MLKATAAAALTLLTLTGTTASATPSSGTSRPPSDVVRTDKGFVRGTVTDTARTFQGIPYARAARWSPPAAQPAWHGVRAATAPGAACAQSGEIPVRGPESFTEDCLFLNVTTPRTPSASGPRPVMVWLHGGDHEDGTGSAYGAQRLADQGDVVVVTLNFRLGAFGYLGDSNLGLQDQQAALRWVRHNAAAFGGDRDNVTLFGQSGGARSACAHLVAPTSAGLFDRAILQSGPCLDEGETRGTDRAAREEAQFAAHVDGPLDQASTRELVAADDRFDAGEKEIRYSPTYGTRLLPRTPQQAFATGRFNRVPVLTGVNRDEETFRASWSVDMAKKAQDPDAEVETEDFRAYVSAVYGPAIADRTVALYTGRTPKLPPVLALGAAMSDAMWARPAVDTDNALGDRTPTYAYEFAQPDNPWFTDFPAPSFPIGAPHLSELPYFFDLGYGTTPLTAEQRTLAASMIGIWSDFARTGRPGWKPYTPADPNVQSIAAGRTGPTDFAKNHEYTFWKQQLG